MKSEDLINVFKDTVELVENRSIRTNSGTIKRDFSNINTEEGYRNANIIVSPLDSVSYVKENKNDKTCILNMASPKRAGGGVVKGSRAQEECLFRCSNLFKTVIQKHYPLKEEECLYTRDAVFFKDFYYNRMVPIIVDVVTIAAINLNNIEKNENYITLTKNKIRLMLSLAEKNEVDTIVLGAWGCGVFKNDPKEMAEMFKDVLIGEKYNTKFKKIIFAIINDHNSVGDNFDIFSKTFSI